MRFVKGLLLSIIMAAVYAGAAESTPAPAPAVEACPVVKVNVTELPQSRKLLLHPELYGRVTVHSPNDAVAQSAVQIGIDLDALWENRSGQILRDIIVRLEFVGSKTFTMRTMEEPLESVRPGDQWVHFKLRGGEYQDTVHIAAWRISVLSGGHMLGHKQSVMWTER